LILRKECQVYVLIGNRPADNRPIVRRQLSAVRPADNRPLPYRCISRLDINVDTNKLKRSLIFQFDYVIQQLHMMDGTLIVK